MKSTYNKLRSFFLSTFVILMAVSSYAQDSTAAATEDVTATPAVKKPKYYTAKPVNVFTSIWLIDNQTVKVPNKGTFEFDIMHRFGPVKEGYRNFIGFFATSNIRLGFSYVPVKDLLVG